MCSHWGSSKFYRRKQKVVAVEDIPNLHGKKWSLRGSILKDGKQQEEFISLVESIVYSRAPSLGPVVFIVSDATKQNNTIIRMIPDAILGHPAGVSHPSSP